MTSGASWKPPPAHAALGAAARMAAEARGRALSLDDAVALALSEMSVA